MSDCGVGYKHISKDKRNGSCCLDDIYLFLILYFIISENLIDFMKKIYVLVFS